MAVKPLARGLSIWLQCNSVSNPRKRCPLSLCATHGAHLHHYSGQVSPKLWTARWSPQHNTSAMSCSVPKSLLDTVSSVAHTTRHQSTWRLIHSSTLNTLTLWSSPQDASSTADAPAPSHSHDTAAGAHCNHFTAAACCCQTAMHHSCSDTMTKIKHTRHNPQPLPPTGGPANATRGPKCRVSHQHCRCLRVFVLQPQW